jgi:hypothetical protein
VHSVDLHHNECTVIVLDAEIELDDAEGPVGLGYRKMLKKQPVG